MKKELLTITCFILLLSSMYAQEATLVSDFNSGNENAFNGFNYAAAYFGEQLIFPIKNEEIGNELGILDNGVLSVLKDINSGTESSNPKELTHFKDEIYFTAYDTINGRAIWKTNGTAAGTSLFFSQGTDASFLAKGLIVSKSGYLYYTSNNELFRTDGLTNTSMGSGFSFDLIVQHRSKTYCTYKDEVAFLKKVGNKFQLYKVEADSIVSLGEAPGSGSFPDAYGLSQVEQGLIFTIYTTFSASFSGTYVYHEIENTISKLLINGEESTIRRYMDFDDNRHLGMVLNRGYYSLTGDAATEELIFNQGPQSLINGVGIVHTKVGDKILFNAGTEFLAENIFLTDGTAAGTNEIVTTQSSYMTNMIAFGHYAFFVSGTSNGFEPQLYYVNSEDGSFSNFYNFSESSSLPNSILLLGIQNEQLYFISNLDADVGRELYSITLDIPDLVISNDPPVANFTFETDLLTATFVDNSTDATTWQWDFGDGAMSTEQNPSHTYATNGTYEVCLTANNESGENTVCQTLSLTTTAISDLVQVLDLTLYPNPSKKTLYLNFGTVPSNMSWAIYDLNGTRVQTDEGRKMTTSTFLIDLSNLHVGMYFLKITDENGQSAIRKVLKQ